MQESGFRLECLKCDFEKDPDLITDKVFFIRDKMFRSSFKV